MKKNVIFLSMILILTACQASGTEGGKCLYGNTCTESNLICNNKNTCEICGNNNKLCCAEGICQNGLACTESGYCQYCGGVGDPCCEGSDCQTNLRCDDDQTCQYCGIVGDPCCEGGICDVSSVCDSQSICQPCGMKGQPCCKSGGYACYEGICGSGDTCQTEICDSGGNCIECGIVSQPCCEGGTCQLGYVCGESNQCESCGWRGSKACAGGTCSGFWQDVNGICSNPFEVDPAAQVSLCENVEPGYSDATKRDWCYWYAAYQKEDTSICTMIVWGAIKEKCQELADPDDYSVVSW